MTALVRTGLTRAALAGTGQLIRLALRRDRIGLPAGLYLIVAVTAGTAYEFGKLYPRRPGSGPRQSLPPGRVRPAGR